MQSSFDSAMGKRAKANVIVRSVSGAEKPNETWLTRDLCALSLSLFCNAAISLSLAA